MLDTETNTLACLIIAIVAGMVLGASLMIFIISKDCAENNYSPVAGGIYCAKNFDQLFRNLYDE